MTDPDEGRFQSPLRAIPLPEMYVTRRRLLAGVGVLGTAGVAELVPLGPIAGWEPHPSTWPLPHRDLSNTAATGATPPTDPSLAWTSAPLQRRDETTVVVGPDRVYVGGDGLAALSRSDGETVWRYEGFDSGELALRDGTLYSATASENYGLNGEDAGIAAFDAATGDRSWLTPLPTDAQGAAEATSFLVADGTVFVGHDDALSAYDAGSGRPRFVAHGSNGGTYLAVSGGELYAAGGRGPITRYRSRDILDVPLGDGPPTAWERDVGNVEYGHPPSVTDGRLYCGRLDERGRAALVARRPDTGRVEWRALPHPDAPTDAHGYEFGVFARPPAVADDTLVTTAVYGGEEAPPTEAVALDPADGSVRWRDSLGRTFPGPVAVAGEMAVVVANYDATDTEPERAEILAYALDSGAERWRVTIEDAVVSLAPVAGTVFVADEGGRVHALRD